MQERKSWNRAFSSTAKKEYEIIVAKRVRQLVGCLECVIEKSDEKASAVVDMTQVAEILQVSFYSTATDLISY